MMGDGEVSSWAVREQLERIERSGQFAGSDKLAVLLRHLVEEVLAGRAAGLKEGPIGNAIYAREPAYDPRFDSTVRVEARRLRRKLAAYYAEPSPQDRVRIDLPTGTYVPLFTWLAPTESQALPEADGGLFRPGTGAAVLILPLTPLSGGAQDVIFADELTDELIFALEKAEGYRVASRQIAFRYRNTGAPIAAVAQELSADGVIHGTVRRAGAVLRVTVELADPSGFAVWSDRFDGHVETPEDGLILQERIAATILSRLRFDSSAMRSGAAGPRPQAIKASAQVYRARQLLDQQTPQALRQALGLFRQVSDTTSDYARGYSGIADCHLDLFRLGLIDHATASREAAAAVRKALSIDGKSVEAHTARATVAAWLDWDRAVAEEAFKTAMALGENARCVRLYGAFRAFCGHHGDAIRLFARARAMEPISTQLECAEALCRFATRHFHDASAMAPVGGTQPAEALYYRALSLTFAGRREAALALAERLDGLDRDIPMLALAAAEVRAWAGAPSDAQQRLGLSVYGGTAFARATLALSLGRHDVALDLLSEAMEAREPGVVWIRTDPRFDAVRDDPRFTALKEFLRPESLAPTALR
ncbi:TPR end-of-group domain-containing protein [Azorhizobium caulinodans]|uniref:TPR end-of-group domain-containing protein n=1 Tax=Azorhizobium caulinodans TaxID=7 RepID=UPI002FBE2D43